MKGKKYRAILFANTLWFINNFKMPLIEELINKNFDIEIIYLRLGPPISSKNKFSVNSIPSYEFTSYLILVLKRIIRRQKIKTTFLFSFTIGPILLSMLPLFNRHLKFATLEGLGRVFSSRAIFFRILKRFIQVIYKIIFTNFYKGIFVLNYSDYAYLLERQIVQISKLHIIPGTGINSKIFNPKSLISERRKLGLLNQKGGELLLEDMFITFIGRISIDKGFYRFIAAINYLLNDKRYSSLKFRIVSPKSDINNINLDLREFLFNKNIVLKEYISNPICYYASSKIIVIPTTYGEGLSRVALEAGFLGVPIVAIQNRGLSSLFMDGVIGETTTDTEPYGISRLIKKIIDNYSEYSYFSENVFNSLSSKYDNKVSANTVINVLSYYFEH